MKPALLLTLALLALTSCFTGVEGTRRVEMSRNDVQATLPTAEDKIVNTLTGLPLNEWQPGRRFTVLDNRAALMFEPQTLPPDPLALNLAGTTISFVKAEKQITPGLDTLTRIVFQDSLNTYLLPLKQSYINSMQLPMITDTEIVERFDSLLSGKQLWVKYPVWESFDSVSVSGLKYVPVTVLGVQPGAGVYPAIIKFKYQDKCAWLPVSLPQSGPQSRSFAQQFSLSDPRLLYPGISNENWHLITRQQVAVGMTKNEARLALGAPKDISQGHNSAMLYELWQYPNGSYLMFEDGLLLRFKLAR